MRLAAAALLAALIPAVCYAQAGLPSVPSVVVTVQGAQGPTGPQGAAGPPACGQGDLDAACHVMSSASAISALANSMPTPSATVPPAATPTGAAGTGNTFIPSNAAAPSLNRSANAVTASDGTFSVTWTTPLSSATPPVNVIPINTGSQPIICNITSRNATTVAGKCWSTTTTTLSLAIITAGLTLNPTAAAAGGVPVMIVAREPTQ